jgi:CRP-like cAMP-binding protein
LNKELLQKIDLLRGLDHCDYDQLKNRCSLRQHKKNSEILRKNDDSTDIFFVIEGEVIARSFSEEGKEVSFTTIKSGELFGEFSAIDGQPRSASIAAMEDSLIAQMTSKDFRELVLTTPELGLRLVELLVAKSRRLSQRIFEYGTLPVRLRVQRELVRLYDSRDGRTGGNLIQPAPSHYEIATRIATHREAVSRELGHLVSENIIELGKRKIKIRDIDRLRLISRNDNFSDAQ